MNKWVLHPLLFAVYVVIGIYSQNAAQVPLHWVWRPLVVSLLFSSVVYSLSYRRYRDSEYSGWLTTVSLFVLFSGHLYRLLLEQSTFWRTPPGGLTALVLIMLPAGFLASRRTWEKITRRQTITLFLNAMSLALVFFSLWNILSTLYQSNSHIQTIRETVEKFEVQVSDAGESRPDIYLIVVDGYGREDYLFEQFGHDNSSFTSFLRQEGFYVAEQSTSNYPQTELSISSSMNLQYLDEFVEGFGGTSDRSPLRELLQHTVLRRLLQEQGYQFVALPSAALFAQMDDADVYYHLTPGDINEFEGLVLASTVAGVAAESWGLDVPVQGYRLHRDYIQFSLEKLREVPALPGPKFVFAHLLTPHPPFIFDREGNFIIPDRPYSTWDASLFPGTTEEYINGYVGQITYLNTQLMDVVSAILAQSPNPPIIILQGDHGPGAYYDTLQLNTSCLAERFSILNAYYFPDGDYESLYPSITPVNTFRIVLTQYFGADLDLLDDRNYFAGWLSPYQFTDISDKINSACIIPH